MIDFSTSQYVFAHGRQPGGRAGSWAFYFPGDPQPWWVRGAAGEALLYSAAKKAARVEAKRRGLKYATVKVAT